MTYSPRQAELYAEAIRTVPAVLQSRHTESREDASVLINGYHDMALRLGIGPTTAWSILFTASTHWAYQLASSVAEHEGVDFPELAQRLGVLALAWDAKRV